VGESKAHASAIDRIAFYVRVTPKGATDTVAGWSKDATGAKHLKLRVAAIADGGKANAAVVALLAKSFGVAKSAVSISRGRAGRLKCIEIVGDAKELQLRLDQWGEIE
jgi:uncharacterized protein YggU (UPF0235/DUF167 family)